MQEAVIRVEDLGGEEKFTLNPETGIFTFTDDATLVVGAGVACGLCADENEGEEFKTWLNEMAVESGFPGHQA